MKAQIIQLLKTAQDGRSTASAVTYAYVKVSLSTAKRWAKDLDALGERSQYAAIFPPRREGQRLAVGHGVVAVAL